MSKEVKIELIVDSAEAQKNIKDVNAGLDKTDKSLKKSRFPDRHPTSWEEKWSPEGPKGSQKGTKIDKKSDQKPSLKSASILSRF